MAAAPNFRRRAARACPARRRRWRSSGRASVGRTRRRGRASGQLVRRRRGRRRRWGRRRGRRQPGGLRGRRLAPRGAPAAAGRRRRRRRWRRWWRRGSGGGGVGGATGFMPAPVSSSAAARALPAADGARSYGRSVAFRGATECARPVARPATHRRQARAAGTADVLGRPQRRAARREALPNGSGARVGWWVMGRWPGTVLELGARYGTTSCASRAPAATRAAWWRWSPTRPHRRRVRANGCRVGVVRRTLGSNPSVRAQLQVHAAARAPPPAPRAAPAAPRPSSAPPPPRRAPSRAHAAAGASSAARRDERAPACGWRSRAATASFRHAAARLRAASALPRRGRRQGAARAAPPAAADGGGQRGDAAGRRPRRRARPGPGWCAARALPPDLAGARHVQHVVVAHARPLGLGARPLAPGTPAAGPFAAARAAAASWPA